MAAKRKDARPIIWMIGFFVAATLMYLGLLVWLAVKLFAAGGAVGVGIGVGVVVLAVLGLWMIVQTLRSGIEHQRMAAQVQELGREVDVDDLPRRPSGRIERYAADELFAQIKEEWEADPGDWVRTYRIARAYDYAGDRSRAREMMRRAGEQYRVARVPGTAGSI